MATVGQVLERTDPQGDQFDRVRLVGVIHNDWIAAPFDSFGSNFTISAADLVAHYGLTDTAHERSEEEVLRERDANATSDAIRAYGKAHAPNGPKPSTEPPPGSPEAVFAAQAAEGDNGI